MSCLLRQTVWVSLLAALAVPALAHDKVRDGGTLGNSWSSQMARVDDTTMRITLRKQVAGDPRDVNRPGSAMYNALNAVANAAAVRAAMEARQLGYKAVQVLGSHNTARVQNLPNLPRGGADAGSASGLRGYSFADGVSQNDVEVTIEVVVRCVEGDVPNPKPSDYIDVEALLRAYGQQ